MNNEPEFIININNDEPNTSHQPVVAGQESLVKPPKPAAQVEKSRREYIKFIGIIIFLLAAATLMSGLVIFSGEELIRWFMGGFFIIFGSFKLINYEGCVQSLREYDAIARKYKLYAYFYPFIELMLGVFYILNMATIFRDSFTIIIMAVGAWGVSKSILRKQLVQSTYLGNVLRLPLTTVNLTENILMGSLAIVMLITSLFS